MGPELKALLRAGLVAASAALVLQACAFDEGSDIEAGRQLYQIDAAPFIATLNTATASLQKAQANLSSTTVLAERYAALVSSNAISKQDYANALAAREQAAADVLTAKAAVAMASRVLGGGLPAHTEDAVRTADADDATR